MVLTGEGGLLPGLIKLALSGGLAGVDRSPGLCQGRSGRSGAAQCPQRQHPENGADRGRPGAWRCRGIGGLVHPTAGAKGQRRIGGLDDMIISLYAGGMTLRDIQFHLASTIPGPRFPMRRSPRSSTRSPEEVLSRQHRRWSRCTW